MSAGFCTTPISTAEGPGISCHSLSHDSSGASISAPDAPARGRIAQPLDQLGRAAVVRPWGNEGREIVEPGGIGVGIGREIDTRAPGGIDLGHDARHPAPVPLPGHLEMPDLDGNGRLAADPDGLVDGGVDLGALRPEVGGVHAAVPRGLRRQRHQLLGSGVRGRRILERSRDADRPLSHRRAHQRPHAVELRRARRPVAVAQHHAPDLGRAHVAREVDADALPLQPGEVLAQRPPVRRDRVVLVVGPIGGEDRIVERAGGSTFAGDLGGDPLKDLRRQARLDQDGELRLAQHVDEAGGHDHPRRVHRLSRRRAVEPPDRRDPPVANAHVRGVPGRAGAVDDAPMVDDEVVHLVLRTESPGRDGQHDAPAEKDADHRGDAAAVSGWRGRS